MIFLFSFLFCLNESWHDLVSESDISVLTTSYEDASFGSLTPFTIDGSGNPVIFISDLALHTQNLQKNSNCSMVIFKLNKDNLFNSQRITLIGKMTKTTDKEIQIVFLKKHKQAKDFIELGDFSFYIMEITKIYYVGEFGDIRWIELEEYKNSFK